MSIRDRSTGTVLAIGFLFLNLASPTSLSLISGFQRSFACPLMIALLYHLHRRERLAASVVVIISALIYPPVFLLAVATWGFSILRKEKLAQMEFPATKEEWIPLLSAFTVGSLILSPIVLPRFVGAFNLTSISDDDNAVADASYKHIWDNPHHRAGGRKPLFYIFPFVGRGGLVNKNLTAFYILVLFSIGFLIYLVRGKQLFDFPTEIWSMLGSSLVLFILDWVGVYLTDSFLLYLPSRYTRVGLFLFFFLIVSLNLKSGIEQGVRLISHDSRKLLGLIGVIEVLVWGFVLILPPERSTVGTFDVRWLLVLTSLLLMLLGGLSARSSSHSLASISQLGESIVGRVFIASIVVAGLLGWGLWARAVSSSAVLDPPPERRDLFKFLRTLPKDILLAGTPCALDGVPLFAKRQILFSCETMVKNEKLMREALKVYYAEDTQRIIDFCQAHGVDYLVIDFQTYTEEYLDAGWAFFEPYNQELLPIVRSRDTFALAQVPDEAKVFQSEEVFVVPCSRVALEE
jgi:hypothetical protein